MSGYVFVDGARVDKAGTMVKEDSAISVRNPAPAYVSRGGVKLEAALKEFKVDVHGKVALDIGASTGGFTDCLLRLGAMTVYAVDVGYGQLDWKLRQDRRVVVKERINARYLNPEDIGELVDIATIDVSFISLTKIIPAAAGLLKPGGTLVSLIKPQFEVGKGEVGKGGIVREEAKHKEVVDKIVVFLEELNFKVLGVIPSPILGADGNKEFLAAGINQG
jgi:23S rRNA (cytidine1920-2'-O)/16S rRNA (cytidine1409-2'-O)-methyltransferase